MVRSPACHVQGALLQAVVHDDGARAEARPGRLEGSGRRERQGVRATTAGDQHQATVHQATLFDVAVAVAVIDVVVAVIDVVLEVILFELVEFGLVELLELCERAADRHPRGGDGAMRSGHVLPPISRGRA